MPSLSKRIAELEARIISDESLGPSTDMPFAIFVYDPKEELKLRSEIERLATRLANEGLHVERIDLGDLMWACFDEHPADPEAIYEVEAESHDLGVVLKEARSLVSGHRSGVAGPLERKVTERMGDLDPESSVAFLVRAGELFPIYRTSALLERLMHEIEVPTVLFYPGRRTGSAELSFMGVCEPSPNYRPRIF